MGRQADTQVDVLVGIHGVQHRVRAVVTWDVGGAFAGFKVDGVTPPTGVQLAPGTVQTVQDSPAVRMQVRRAAELATSRR